MEGTPKQTAQKTQSQNNVYQTIYPLIHMILGQQLFDKLMEQFNGHKENSLHQVLASTEPFSKYPFLAELAEVEKIIYETRYASSHPMEPKQIQEFRISLLQQFNQVVIEVSPGLVTVNCQFAFHDLYKMAGKIDLKKGASLTKGQYFYAISHNPQGGPALSNISKETFELLNELASGPTAVSHVTRKYFGNDPNKARNTMLLMAQLSWIDSFRVLTN